jgi:hypothetical protein
MLIDALYATLENRPDVFNRVGVNLAAHVFIVRMNNGVSGLNRCVLLPEPVS